MRKLFTLTALLTLILAGCDSPVDAEEVVTNIDRYVGKRITMRAKFRSGAQCRVGDEEGEWKTYCKDCQYCRGPLVVDVADTATTADAWPMILGGTWDWQDIRCKGPLNAVKCYPFEPGKMYIVEGKIENQKPPKLLVSDFKLAEP